MTAAKEMEGKKIPDQLEQNKSETLKYICFEWQDKAKKDIIEMPCIRDKDGNV